MAKVRKEYTSDGSLVFTSKSGNLSNAIKKELNRRSFELSTIPDYVKTTGYEINNDYEPFYDWSIVKFNQQDVNNVIGLPLINFDTLSPDNVILNDPMIYRSEQDASYISDQAFIRNKLNSDETFKRDLKSLSIFGTPNVFTNFGFNITDPGTNNFYNTKSQQVTKKNVDDIIVKKEINKTYEPYKETLKFSNLSSDSWNTEEIQDIKNSKQISLNLDFSGTGNAILTETGTYDFAENYARLENRVVSKKNQPTAYYNFNQDRWEYLSPKNDYYFPLDVTQNQNAGNVNNFIRQKASDFANERKVMSTPSFRLDANNKSSFMKLTSSYGFPNSRSWDPKNDHLLDMSKYISSDFYLENIIIKFNVIPSMTSSSLNNNFVAGADEEAFYGMSFFFMRQIEEEKIRQENKVSNFNFYVDADPDNFDPDNLYSQQTTSFFKDLSLTSTIDTANNQIFEYETNASDPVTRGSLAAYTSLNEVVFGQDYIDGAGEIQYQNYFHYITEEDLNPGTSQLKIADSIDNYNGDNFLNVYGINSLTNQENSNSYRDIISVNNVMFVGSDTSESFLNLINQDKNIDKVVTRDSALGPDQQSIELHSKLKKSYSYDYTDESKYLDSNDNNITILEGKFLPSKSSRIHNRKINTNLIDSNFVNEIGYELIKEGQRDITEEYSYLLKPSDKIIFGISSHSNGNISSSMTELFNNIEIILIGKDAEQIHGENSSKSIRKTIDSVTELDQNSRSISMRGAKKTNNFTRLEKSFFKNNKAFKEKIHDSVLPNIVDYIDLINKSPKEQGIGDFLYVNYTLSSHKKTNDVQVVNSNNVLFYDEVYDNYIFNQFLDNNEFTQKRSTQKSIKGTLESKIDYNSFNSVNTTLAFSNRGVMFSAKNKYKDYSYNPLFFMPESSLYGSKNLIRYTLPSYNSDKNNSALDVINDDVFKFLSSNQNYGIDLSDANEFMQCSVTIQKYKDKYYIVLQPGTESAMLNTGFYVLVNQLKSLDGFEMIDTPIGNQYFVKNSKHSNLTLPLTLRSLITYNSLGDETIEVGRDESSGFTKEFILVEPDTIQEDSSCFVALLEDWELVNIVNPYNGSLPAEQQTSNRSEVTEILFTDGVYNADCLIKSIVDEFVSYASEWDDNNGYDYFEEISVDNYENENNSFITLSAPSMDIGLSNASRFLSHAGRRINVEFHLTKYKLKRSSGTLSDTGNIYKNKNLIGENYSRPFSERGKFLYSDDNVFETNFSIKKKIHDNVGKEINKIPEFINNEVIYHTECFYVASADSTIEKIRKTDYDIIFKYLDFSHNGINFPQIFIYDIFSKKNKVKDYKAGNNFNNIFSYLELPESGFLRVYEPRIYEQYKLGFIKPGTVPYFQINLSDFTIALQNRKEPEDFDQEPVSLSTMSNEHILLDASAYQTSKNENYQDIEFSYGPWGSTEKKDRFVNDIIYTYGKNYSFPVYEKKGYVYGIQSSSPLSAETYFNNYRYGHFSDHVKYTKNYVTTRNIRTRQILSYTVQKTFYNSTFEVVDNSNLMQTHNSNYYAQSNYPFIENTENQLSQNNFDHPLYDINFAY